MRHKTFLINPEIVFKKGIEIYKCVQKPGEFVITFGGSYHAGFNMGLNCAEAVNFATKNWIDLGIKAKFCKCIKDSVQIAFEDFLGNLYKKRFLKKKEFEEHVELFHQLKQTQELNIEDKDKESDSKNSDREKNPKRASRNIHNNHKRKDIKKNNPKNKKKTLKEIMGTKLRTCKLINFIYLFVLILLL